MAVAEKAAVAVVAAALLLSTLIFTVDVFIKGRHRSGPVIGLVFSVIAIPMYFIAFADRLPGAPSGLRGTMSDLPGVHESSGGFHSSVAALALLVLTYALRLGIYTRLFIIPAFTMSEAEYHSREQTSSRANDLTAPLLAYLAFALTAAALAGEAYHLRTVIGALICVALLAAYFASSYLRNLERALALAAVTCRIAVLNFWLLLSALVIWIVLFLGRLEMWRTRSQPEDELFFTELEMRMRKADQKIRVRINQEHERLQVLAAGGEGE